MVFKGFIIILLFMIILGCSLPENLGLPTWTTKLQFYILNDTYQITQLAEEDSSLVAYGDTLVFQQTISDTNEIKFSTELVTEIESTKIGDIEIDNPSAIGTEISLEEIAPHLSDGFLAEPGVLPFIMPVIIKDDLELFDEFENGTFLSGIMQFSLTNHTAIWLGNIDEAEPLVLTILNSDDEVVMIHTFSQDIPPNAVMTISETEDMAGITMDNFIKVQLSGGSKGTDGQSANIVLADVMDIEVSLFDLVADEVTAKIPAQDLNDEYYLVLDESITIYTAIIANGDHKLVLNLTNNIDLEIVIDLSTEYLWLSGQSEPFQQQILIPASGGQGNSSNYYLEIDLQQATMGNGSVPLDSLQIFCEAWSIDSEDEYRYISSQDEFNIEFQLSELNFDYVSGILRPKEQESVEGDKEIAIEYPHIIGEFSITGYSEIVFDFHSPIPAVIEIDLFAENDNGDLVYLREIGSDELPIIIIDSGNSQEIFTSDEYNINDMLSILPTNISYIIYPTVGDENEIFEYNGGEQIIVDIMVESQLDLAADCWLIPKNEDGEPDFQVIDTKEFKEQHLNAFQNASIQLNYLNFLGLDTGARLLITKQKEDDFAQLATPDTTDFKIINIPLISQTNGDDFDQIDVTIDSGDLDFFLADSVFVIPKILLQTEEGFPLSGSITLQAKVEVDFEISNELTD